MPLPPHAPPLARTITPQPRESASRPSNRRRRGRHPTLQPVEVDRFLTSSGDRVLDQLQSAYRANPTQVEAIFEHDPFSVGVLRDGFKIHWRDSRPVQDRLPVQRTLEPEEDEAFNKEHERLLEIGVARLVRQASEPPPPGEEEFISPVFAVHQGSGDSAKWRPIFNLKPMNRFMEHKHFKMTGTGDWKALCRKDLYMASLDVKDAYLHIPSAREDIPLQRYKWRGAIWELRALPFGMAQAPWAFTKFMEPLLRRWRRLHGISVLAWIDDFILGHPDKDHLQKALQEILDDLSLAGIRVNTKPNKSVLVPTKRLTWCGIDWNTRSQMLLVPKVRRDNVRRSCKSTLTHLRLHGSVPARMLSKTLGKIQACAEAVLPQRAFSSELIRDLSSAIRKAKGYEQEVELSNMSVVQLQWWVDNLRRWNGVSWAQEKPASVLTTDASPWAWGAILRMHGDVQTRQTSGFFTPKESRLTQNEREALGVRYGIAAFSSVLKTHLRQLPTRELMRLIIEQDNSSVVSYIRRQGGKKRSLGRLIEPLLQSCFERRIWLLAKWVPGWSMEADALSRELAFRDLDDWAVRRSTFKKICSALGVLPSMDLFASRLNAQSDKFYSFLPDPMALDFDALSPDKNWAALGLAWAAPPVELITCTLEKCARDQASLLLFVPHWPSAPWWSAMQCMRKKSSPPHQSPPSFLSPMIPVPLNSRTIRVGHGRDPTLQGHGRGEAVAVLLLP